MLNVLSLSIYSFFVFLLGLAILSFIMVLNELVGSNMHSKSLEVTFLSALKFDLEPDEGLNTLNEMWWSTIGAGEGSCTNETELSYFLDECFLTLYSLSEGKCPFF
jgi:hypothetical protein